MGKIKVGLLFGGMSAEHDVSIMSATAIYKNLDREKFTLELIYISRDGEWLIIDEENLLDKKFPENKYNSFIPWDVINTSSENDIDIYFPVLHGPNGEDGKIQSIFELSGKPFVGANSFSSALAMDKVISKTLFRSSDLQTADFLFFTKNNLESAGEKVKKYLEYPVFVKPCSLGSSVGISKVKSKTGLKEALDLGFQYDQKVIVERALKAREIEISVMGNEDVKVSRPGELIPYNEIYDYEDKYIAGKTQFKIPVELDPGIEKQITEMAEKAYRSHFMNGMARIDFFLERDTDEVYINEINTIPGFTEISMFPKLWQVEGITFTDLVTKLIDYGFDYFRH